MVHKIMDNQIQTLREILSVFPADAKAIFHLAIGDVSVGLADTLCDDVPEYFDSYADLVIYMHELINEGKKASNRQLSQAEDMLAEQIKYLSTLSGENAVFIDVLMSAISSAIDIIADWNEQKILGSMKDESDFTSQSVVLRDMVLQRSAEQVCENAKLAGSTEEEVEEIRDYILTLCETEEEGWQYDEDFEEEEL